MSNRVPKIKSVEEWNKWKANRGKGIKEKNERGVNKKDEKISNNLALSIYIGIGLVLLLIGIALIIKNSIPEKKSLPPIIKYSIPERKSLPPIPYGPEILAYNQKFREILSLTKKGLEHAGNVSNLTPIIFDAIVELSMAQDYIKEAYLKYQSLSPPKEVEIYHGLMGLALDNYNFGIQLLLEGVKAKNTDICLKGARFLKMGNSLVETSVGEIERTLRTFKMR